MKTGSAKRSGSGIKGKGTTPFLLVLMNFIKFAKLPYKIFIYIGMQNNGR